MASVQEFIRLLQEYDTFTYSTTDQAWLSPYVGLTSVKKPFSRKAVVSEVLLNGEIFETSRESVSSFVGDSAEAGMDDLFLATSGSYEFFGGKGIDTVSYYGLKEDITVKLGRKKAVTASKKDDLNQVENVLGGLGNDTLKGKKGTNVLFGDDGLDKLVGKGGNDVLIGGNGPDILKGGKGFDFVSYAMVGAAENPRANGVLIDLKLKTGEGGHADGDTLLSIEGVIGTIGADTLIGKKGKQILAGHKGDDDLSGAGGKDQLYGGLGNDFLDGGRGKDYLDGGSGEDTVGYRFSRKSVEVNLETGQGSGPRKSDARGDTLVGIENIFGSDFDDSLTGDNNDNYLLGGRGDDVIKGGDGSDVLYGMEGHDILNGGDGFDFVSYYYADGPVIVSLLNGKSNNPTNDVYKNIEGVFGSQFSDTLSGNDEDNSLFGGDENDVLRGKTGDDFLSGGNGKDELHGGEGFDMTSYRHSDAGVEIDLEDGTGFGGDAEGDTLFSIEDVIGSEHDDTLRGDSSDNYFAGRKGDDRLVGSGGDDVLEGGGGNDTLIGGAGENTLIGGTGQDTFVFIGELPASDIIQDFTLSGRNDDTIQISTDVALTFAELNFAFVDTEVDSDDIAESTKITFENHSGFIIVESLRPEQLLEDMFEFVI